MTTPRHQSLLKDLGVLIGFEDFALDDDGTASLAFDELDVIFAAEDERHLALFAPLGKAGSSGGASRTLLEEMLAANCFQRGTAGGALGYDPERKVFVLSHRVALDGLEAGGLFALVETFVDLGEAWTARLAADEGGGSEPAGAEAEPSSYADPGAGFIRI